MQVNRKLRGSFIHFVSSSINTMKLTLFPLASASTRAMPQVPLSTSYFTSTAAADTLKAVGLGASIELLLKNADATLQQYLPDKYERSSVPRNNLVAGGFREGANKPQTLSIQNFEADFRITKDKTEVLWRTFSRGNLISPLICHTNRS